LRVYLACGFSPLHLGTFLSAEIQCRFPDRKVEVETGLYGDIAGNVQRMSSDGCDSGAVVLEWADLDRRLGLRQSGRWNPGDLPDIVNSARRSAARIEDLLAATKAPVAVSLPGLSLPPANITPTWQAGAMDLELLECAVSLAASLSRLPNVRVVHPQFLDLGVAPGERYDLKSELLSGFPYQVSYASALAHALRLSLYGPPAKKALITDLDDTLWSGIVGDAGVNGVSWDLDHGSQPHAVYQRLLSSFAAAGILLGIASKNDPAVVEEALRRRDLLVPADQFFPVEAHWQPKSESVARILAAWNIAADSVVFVDDSPLECAEVKAAHPGMECVLFPRNDYAKLPHFYRHLRDLFGKAAVREEDILRRESLRSAASRAVVPKADTETFLGQLDAEVEFCFDRQAPDGRAFELVNKTNQFNLNGRRYTEGEWQAALAEPGAFLATVAYRDKYGPLGTIAAVLGRREGDALRIQAWVLSCRAFARRIEHRTLEELFRRCQVSEVIFEFAPTLRNGPLHGFLTEMCGAPSSGGYTLRQSDFSGKCPPLYHRVHESGGEVETASKHG
jgi:FkbH-like protein